MKSSVSTSTVASLASPPRKFNMNVKNASYPVDLFWKLVSIWGTRDETMRNMLDFCTSYHSVSPRKVLPWKRTKE